MPPSAEVLLRAALCPQGTEAAGEARSAVRTGRQDVEAKVGARGTLHTLHLRPCVPAALCLFIAFANQRLWFKNDSSRLLSRHKERGSPKPGPLSIE